MLRTAEIISAVCCTQLRSSLWCVQRSSPWCVAHRGDYLNGMLQNAEIVLRCVPHRGGNFVIKYLDEIKTESENTSFSLFIRGPDGFES